MYTQIVTLEERGNRTYRQSVEVCSAFMILDV